MGTAVKTSAGCVWRKVIPLSNTNSGPTPDSNVNDHPLKHMEHRGSKGSISGIGTIRLGNLVFDDVAFVKELGHFNLFSISQICDKTLNVLFTEKECFVVSSDFKMPDENQVLLKVPRQHNMYTFDMKNVDSSKGYTCLLAKASSNEAKLWHRRLGHLNFKNLNKLVKGNLVRGLPSKSFKNDHTCVACQKGKQHKASCKAKIEKIFKLLEEKPNVQGIGHRWMFDLDYLTDSMNYIPVSLQNQANPAGSKEVIDIDVQTEEAADLMVVSSTSLTEATRNAAVSEKIAKKKTHSSKQPSSTPISKSADDIMTFRKELDALALKHLGPVPATAPTSTNPVNTGSDNLNTGFEEVTPGNIEAISPSADHEEEVFSDADDDEMPEIRIYDKSSEGIFEKASYDDDGIITDFNNLQKRKSPEALKMKAGWQAIGMKNCAVQASQYGSWLFTHGAKVKGTKVNVMFTFSVTPKTASSQCCQEGFFKTIVATSTTEAEICSCCQIAVGQVLWVKSIVGLWFQLQEYQNPTLIMKAQSHWEEPRFAEIVDFLRGSNLRYALTANPPIYDSLVKQFWQSAITTSNTDGSLEIRATIDTIRYTISEASIRDSLQLDDATGITMLPNADLFEGMGQIGYNIATALICLSSGRVYNFSKLIFDGMVANLKSKTKFLMYPRFLQMILNIQTENKTLYLAVSLTKKIFGNMKRGFRGAPRPLLPSMLLVATNPNAGQEHAAVAPSQPSSSTPQAPTPPPIPTPTPPPIPTPTPPPIPTPIPPPIPTPTPTPIPTPIPPPIPTPTSPPPPPPETEPTTDEPIYEAPSHMPMDDLLQAVPKLISRIDSLEMDLKQTKLTMGNAIVKLVKKVKKLEGFMKRRNLVLTDSEEEEPEAQGRRGGGGGGGGAQGRKSQDDPQDSSVQGLVTPPTTKVNTSGEEQVEEISPNTLEAAKTLSKVASLKPRSIDKGRRYKRRKETKGKKVVSSLDFQEEVDDVAEQVNTAGEEVNTVSEINTGSIKLNTGIEQASTVGEDKGQREGKAPMLSEETPKKSKEQILQEEASLAEAIRLDSLQKEEEASNHIGTLSSTKIAEEEELTEQQKKRKAQSMLGSELQGEDFAKRMVDLVNQRKKFFAEERAKAKRNKPMTQSQLKTYMMNYLKNQGTWKLNQLRKLSFEEVKKEFDKLVKPDKVGEQEETVTGTETPINPIPVAMKTPSVATYKIIKQGEKSISND
ncbi:ribonuclease H-like domain-containing protein [Tanacetum coccineum]|uniref:Ribonuclease H-like domain-containing protein n=1 Tax=Tanacetum coccineum TaxID=301880 RepID=A0ABQ5IPD2_9ASTR